MASSDQQRAPKRPPSFVGVVQAAERFLSFHSTGRNQPQPSQPPAAGPFKLDPSSIRLEDLESEDFPKVSQEKLLALFEGDGFDNFRKNAQAALQDMEMNFKLDPKTLGERSETHKGYQAIALLLSRLQVDLKSRDDLKSGPGGQVSGQFKDQSDGGDEGSAGDSGSKLATGSTSVPPPRNYETHDLLRAIDQKDSMTILSIRDANFDLLLDLTTQGGSSKNSAAAAQAGGSSNTPLGYSIGLGKGWEGISIVLVGALSKFVNTLSDEEEEQVQAPALAPGIGLNEIKKRRPRKVELDPRTMARLRKVRMNLKLAIDHSIFTDQTRLLASYLQVLVMSEGTQFLYNSIASVQHTLTTKTSDPVTQARSAVLQFCSDALRHKQDRVAAVKDYISNATADLILMSIWDLIKPNHAQVDDPDLAHSLPLYFFARDDRVTAHFIEKVEKLGDNTTKHRGVVKLAKHLSDDLQAGTRRKTSDERLAVIETRFSK